MSPRARALYDEWKGTDVWEDFGGLVIALDRVEELIAAEEERVAKFNAREAETGRVHPLTQRPRRIAGIIPTGQLRVAIDEALA